MLCAQLLLLVHYSIHLCELALKDLDDARQLLHVGAMRFLEIFDRLKVALPQPGYLLLQEVQRESLAGALAALLLASKSRLLRLLER